MRILACCSAILLLLLLSACSEISSAEFVRGSGKVTSEDRPAQNVHGVALTTMGELAITQGDQESLRVEAEDNLLSYIETPVQGGTLTIRTRPNTSVQPTRPVHYYLTVKGLESLTTSSNGNINGSVLQTDHLMARISSNGNIHLDGLNANNLQVQISSNGNVEIGQGDVEQQTVTLTSSGQYKGGGLRSKEADARLSSSGNATIWVTDRLKASLSSSGNLRYYGSPDLNASTPSSGRLISLGDK
jgi:Putative auto-transporter adhesin, head GIN domain